jgi:tRNA(Arg) A34 adenosine deaminase TadA
MNQPEGKYMKLAIAAAEQSANNGDYGHGAVVVKDGEVIATGYETLKSANDPINGHAEIDAIRKACKKLGQPYLQDCMMYCTAEPCPMCMSAIIWAKMAGVAYAITRDDMIAEMERLKKTSGGNFSWRQIAIPAEYIVEHGEPKVSLFPGFMREEGQKLFELTGK